MASASPPPPPTLPSLPISNPVNNNNNNNNNGNQSQAALFVRLSDSVRLAYSQRRSWSELIDRSAFGRPESLSDAAARVRKNFSYFRINYLTLVASVIALSLLTHPLSLLVLLFLLASWIFLYLFRPSDAPPLLIFGRTFTDRETLAALLLLSLVLVFLTSVGSLLISALMFGLAVVCSHAAFRLPEDLFLDDQQPAPTTGLLSFLANSAPVVLASPV